MKKLGERSHLVSPPGPFPIQLGKLAMAIGRLQLPFNELPDIELTATSVDSSQLHSRRLRRLIPPFLQL